MPLSEFRSWSYPDRALAMALDVYEDGLCGGCGHPTHLTMDQANQRDWVADAPVRCHACTAREKKAAEYGDARQPGALRFPVRLVKRARKSRP